jgi:hypothetical protein
MEAFNIKSNNKQVIITIDKSLLDIDFINNLYSRLRVEELIKKANFKRDVVNVSENIKKDWWAKNKHNDISLKEKSDSN